MTRMAFFALIALIFIGVAGSLAVRWMQWPGERMVPAADTPVSTITAAWSETNAREAPSAPALPANIPTDARPIVPGDWALTPGATLRLSIDGEVIDLVVEHVDVTGPATTIRAVNDSGVRAILTQGERSRFGSVRLPGAVYELWGNTAGTWLYPAVMRGNPRVPDFKTNTDTVRFSEPVPSPRLEENPHR